MELCKNYDCVGAKVGDCKEGKEKCAECTTKDCGYCTNLEECVNKMRTKKGREVRFCKDFDCDEISDSDCLCETAYHCGGCARFSVCDSCSNYDDCIKNGVPKYIDYDNNVFTKMN